MATIPTTVTAAVRLCGASGGPSVWHAVCIAVALVYVCVPLLCLLCLPRYATVSLQLTLVQSSATADSAVRDDAPLLVRAWKRLMSFASAARHSSEEWGVALGGRTPMVSGLAAVLEEHRALWYPALDGCVLVMASTAAGVSELSLGVWVCRGSITIVLVMYVTQLVVVAALRPFSTRLTHAASLATQALLVLALCARRPFCSQMTVVM